MNGDALLVVPSRLEAAGLGRSAAAVCGIGPVAAALGMAAILARRRPGRVLLAGIAGTRDPARLPVRGLCLASAVLNAGVGAGHGAAFVPLGAMGLPRDESLPPDRFALADWPGAQAIATGPHAAPGAASAGAGRLVRGVSATVAAASADGEQARVLPGAALIEEMEGWAVALACAAADVPLSMLRAVSNVAGDRRPAQWDVRGALDVLARALDALEFPRS